MPSSVPDDPADRIRQILREQEFGSRKGLFRRRWILTTLGIAAALLGVLLWRLPSKPSTPSVPAPAHIPSAAATVCYNMGNEYHRMGKLREAIEAFEEAIRIDPLFGEAWNNRASARHDAGDLPGAESDLDEALRLDPNDPELYKNRAFVRKARGNPAGAIEDLEHALRLLPEPSPLRTEVERLRHDLK